MWVVGRVCTRWVGLRVTATEMIIYFYLHVVKNIFPWDDSLRQTNLSDYAVEFI